MGWRALRSRGADAKARIERENLFSVTAERWAGRTYEIAFPVSISKK